MAASVLPLNTLVNLPNDFWQNESRVNGVWNNLLNAYFQGNNFVVSPESVLDGATRRLRADLNVIQINPPRNTIRPLSIALSFEGKREGAAAPNVDAVIGQLQTYASHVPKANGNFFCIAAIGQTFKLFLKTDADSMVGLSMSAVGGKPVVASRTGGATAATAHNILQSYGRLLSTLQWISTHTFPLTNDF